MRNARSQSSCHAAAGLTFVICAMASTAAAQWLSVPLPGTPRTPDGKPNLNTTTPRTAEGKPDLSGIWRADSPRWNENLAPEGSDAPMLPAAAELYRQRVATQGWNRPETYCMPHGVPDAMTVAGLPFKILQMPGVTVLLYEEFHKYRQIHSDGRQLPINPDPAWYGYSIGRWEGDTFVVETAGFKEGSWLDNSGHPHTDALRTTERFHRLDFGHMEVDVTINDPKAYSRPWKSATMHFTLMPDTELPEHLCENNRDLPILERYWLGKQAKNVLEQTPTRAQALDPQGAPLFRVDPLWPKPLPNRWSMQQATGLYVEDKTGHIWFLNRGAAADGDEIGGDGNPPRIDCCVRGPEVFELDQEGKVVHAWGGPGYVGVWPTALQTIIADREGNIWIGRTAPQDSILKFSRDGKLLWDFGHRPQKDSTSLKEDNQQTDVLASKGRFNLDEDAREIYIINWKRVLVYDMDTGAFKRGWGGHGMALAEISNDPIPPYKWTGAPPPEEKNFVPDLHFVEFDKDGLVYIGERGQDRISIYTKQGKWIKDYYVSPNTPSRGPDCGGLPPNTKMPPCGTTYKMVFSKDPQQKYMYVADGTNNKVWILDRATGKTLGSFGSNGKYSGQFHWINAIGTDRQGNIYTGEVEQAKRIQKFVPVAAGEAPATSAR